MTAAELAKILEGWPKSARPWNMYARETMLEGPGGDNNSFYATDGYAGGHLIPLAHAIDAAYAPPLDLPSGPATLTPEKSMNTPEAIDVPEIKSNNGRNLWNFLYNGLYRSVPMGDGLAVLDRERFFATTRVVVAGQSVPADVFCAFAGQKMQVDPAKGMDRVSRQGSEVLVDRIIDDVESA